MPIEKLCAFVGCQKTFRSKPSKNQKYCSRICFYEAMRTPEARALHRKNGMKGGEQTKARFAKLRYEARIKNVRRV